MHIPKDLVKVSTSRSRVREGQANDLLRINHEDSPDRVWKSFRITIGGILGIQHIVQNRNLPVFVRDLKEIIHIVFGDRQS